MNYRAAEKILTGQTTVAVVGTAVPLVGPDVNLAVVSIKLKGAAGNAGIVYYGNDGEDDVDEFTGVELHARETEIIAMNNPQKVYLDASAIDQIVCWEITHV